MNDEVIYWLNFKDDKLGQLLNAVNEKQNCSIEESLSFKSSETDISTAALSAVDFEVKYDSSTHLVQSFKFN